MIHHHFPHFSLEIEENLPAGQASRPPTHLQIASRWQAAEYINSMNLAEPDTFDTL